MSLREYARKRRFDSTPEPVDRASRRTGHRPIFVVQLHHARARHYDFRLEVDGALRSWAVPKGPSLRPADKRLAVEVEDHPLAYADFEGDIPEGHYGAGDVVIFDRGVWSAQGDPAMALAAGKLDFTLQGEHLTGGWTLVRTRMQGGKQQWLLIKRDDAHARDAESDDLRPLSADSSRARSRAVAGSPREGRKARKVSPEPPAGEKPSTTARVSERRDDWHARAMAQSGARDRPLSGDFQPQLATLRANVPAGGNWLHEVKWDGYRLLADMNEGRARLRSRNGLDWTGDFPAIVSALQALPIRQACFDGELVALDSAGRGDFPLLQRTLAGSARAPLRYLLFDLPGLAGVDLTQVAQLARKDLLEAVLAENDADALAYSSHIVGYGAEVWAGSGEQGLEGLICKRVDAPYAQRRSDAWVKVKHHLSDDFIVVGYTEPKGSRSGFGSLLMAEMHEGALRYAGRVGSGYDDTTLASLSKQLSAVRIDTPVVTLPDHVPFSARAVRWVKPMLVVEVAFRGRGKEGLLRQASFQRLRSDKTAEDMGMPTSRKTETVEKKVDTRPRTKARPVRKVVRDTGKASTASTVDPVIESVTITHGQRAMFADSVRTKADLAEYYRAVADYLMPELAGRPLSLLRCPQGSQGECFFQKHHADSLGDHVESVSLREKSGGRVKFIQVTDIQGVIELVQMNAIEFHPWGARVDSPEQPDRLVFDLDPAPGITWPDIVAAARDVRARLDEIGLASFVRLSGGKGVHVVVPIRRGPGWDAVRDFCESFAQAMVAQRPLAYVATMSKAKREGRIFIDWLRNGRGATSVTSWSARARAGAPVAMPLRWDELGRVGGSTAFDLVRARRRAASLRGDPWDGIGALDQALPAFDTE